MILFCNKYGKKVKRELVNMSLPAKLAMKMEVVTILAWKTTLPQHKLQQ